MVSNKKSGKSEPASAARLQSGTRPSVTSSPEIKVAYAPLGRETLEAIASELDSPDGVNRSARPLLESTPDIVIGTTPVGRETLAAIEAELEAARPMARSKGRRGRSSRPPAVKRETNERRVIADAIPEIVITGAAELTEPAATASNGRSMKARSRAPAAAATEIFEMLTFVVKNVENSEFSTESLRRAFVERHLTHCLRGHTLEAIERVDVTPWTERGAVVARIWCRV